VFERFGLDFSSSRPPVGVSQFKRECNIAPESALDAIEAAARREGNDDPDDLVGTAGEGSISRKQRSRECCECEQKRRRHYMRSSFYLAFKEHPFADGWS